MSHRLFQLRSFLVQAELIENELYTLGGEAFVNGKDDGVIIICVNYFCIENYSSVACTQAK